MPALSSSSVIVARNRRPTFPPVTVFFNIQQPTRNLQFPSKKKERRAAEGPIPSFVLLISAFRGGLLSSEFLLTHKSRELPSFCNPIRFPAHVRFLPSCRRQDNRIFRTSKKNGFTVFFCCFNMIGMITYQHEYRTHNKKHEEKTSAQAGGDGKGATLHHRIADEDLSQMRQSKLPMCGRKRAETSSSSFNHKDQREDPCDLCSSGYG